MSINFPTSIDSLTNPLGTDNLSSPAHATQHTNENDAVEALEAKVGIDSSAVTTSHDYKLSGVTGTDKAVSKTGTETLTNKTLTAPVITSKSSTGTDSGTETLINKTLTSPIIRAWDGWEDANETWTYASASTITVPSGAASKYAVGDRIKWTQTTIKYGVIVTVADTLLTIAVNTDYTVVDATITANYYSHGNSPIGYPGWFTYTPVFGGFSADPTALAKFSVVGRVCSISILSSADGTSNATTFTITMPITNALGNVAGMNASTAIDNGAEQAAAPVARITNASTTCTIYKTHNSTSTWTNSGGKRVVTLNGTYPI